MKVRCVGAWLAIGWPAQATYAQEATRTMQPSVVDTLTFTAALAMARDASPELRAAREAVAAAVGRERQAAARGNPTLSYSREQTGHTGQSNSQDIAAFEQPIEVSGQRAARVAAARLARAAAAVRLRVAAAQLDFDVTQAYVAAVAADRRADLARQVAAAFVNARRVSEVRLAAGDVSGYAARRIRLEAARYATLVSEAALLARSSRLALAALVAPEPGSPSLAVQPLEVRQPLEAGLLERTTIALADATNESLLARSMMSRAEIRLAELEAELAEADGRLASRERFPVPVVSAGFKREQVATSSVGATPSFMGFLAGISLPLPLWDRRHGTMAASTAEHRQRLAQVSAVRRRVVREVELAAESVRVADAQIALLAPLLASDARPALSAAHVAYSEGEITLLEWLDGVRAYYEAETSYTTLLAERRIRRAALELAVGAALTN